MIFTKDDIFDDVSSIDFQGRSFVLTGTFTIGSRGQVKNIIIQRGGIIKSRLSGNINYLIVGEVASEGWKHGNYGNKIEEALKIKKEKDFLELKIVHEQSFIKSLDKTVEDKEENFIDSLKECFLKEEKNPIKPSSGILIDDYGKEVKSKHFQTDDPFKEILHILSLHGVLYYHDYVQFVRYLYDMLPKQQQEQHLDEIVLKIHSMILNSVNMLAKGRIESVNKLKTTKGKLNRLQKDYDYAVNWVGCYMTKDVQKIIDTILDEKNKIKNCIELKEMASKQDEEE